MNPSNVNATIVSAPSRLHFGLFSIGDQLAYRFGGAGLMIDRPRTVIRSRRADRLTIAASDVDRLRPIVERWFAASHGLLRDQQIHSHDELPVELSIDTCPPVHCGLGSGTQLALSIATSLVLACGLPMPNSDELATSVDRGKRSAIGSHGFLRGGFLVDRGKRSDQLIAPLDLRVDFPSEWRVVTIINPNASLVFGAVEKSAFESLPPTTPAQRNAMVELMKNRVIPALMNEDFESFCQHLFEFGRRSGTMFQDIQGGPFNGPQVEAMIDLVREFGLAGTGQSSWGPCVYAITPDEGAANDLASFLVEKLGPEVNISICRGDNQGVQISTESAN
ncbi:MAG: hypothetical protein AAFN77_04790 [Planctomycetota bacterium]